MIVCMLRILVSTRSVPFLCEVLLRCVAFISLRAAAADPLETSSELRALSQLKLVVRAINLPRLLATNATLMKEFTFIALFLFVFLYCFASLGQDFYGGVIKHESGSGNLTTTDVLEDSLYGEITRLFWPFGRKIRMSRTQSRGLVNPRRIGST